MTQFQDYAWAIDPGKGKPHALAAFDAHYDLRTVWFASNALEAIQRSGSDQLPQHVVYERPRVYPYGGKRKHQAPPNDLLDLEHAASMLVGALTAGGCSTATRVHSYFPRQWKGPIAKPKHHLALWRAMPEAWRGVLGGAETAEYIHRACEAIAYGREPAYGAKVVDLLDAVGIGAKMLVDSRCRRMVL